jgi:putative ABC transport system permease protein
VDESREIQGVLSSLPQATRNWNIESEQLLYKSDPLTLGLRSVIFLGYSLTLVLCMVGFATHFYMNARKRAAVYSILRALGLSTSQLYASLVLEQIIIIISGLGLGIILGSMLNKMILPGLPISFGDLPAIPPFIPQSEWSAVIRIILVLLGGFLLILASGTFFLWRIKLHQVLRIGEE